MLTHKHAIISAAIGGLAWWKTRDPRTCAAALIAGILPDADHVADYAYYRWRGKHRLILPLHGYEYALAGGGLALVHDNRMMRVAVLSYLTHLLADQSENHTHQFGYSLLFRAWHRFQIEEISSIPEAAIRGREADIRLLQKLFHRGVSLGQSFFYGRGAVE